MLYATAACKNSKSNSVGHKKIIKAYLIPDMNIWASKDTRPIIIEEVTIAGKAFWNHNGVNSKKTARNLIKITRNDVILSKDFVAFKGKK